MNAGLHPRNHGLLPRKAPKMATCVQWEVAILTPLLARRDLSHKGLVLNDMWSRWPPGCRLMPPAKMATTSLRPSQNLGNGLLTHERKARMMSIGS
jgi:hypothetical protein